MPARGRGQPIDTVLLAARPKYPNNATAPSPRCITGDDDRVRTAFGSTTDFGQTALLQSFTKMIGRTTVTYVSLRFTVVSKLPPDLSNGTRGVAFRSTDARRGSMLPPHVQVAIQKQLQFHSEAARAKDLRLPSFNSPGTADSLNPTLRLFAVIHPLTRTTRKSSGFLQTPYSRGFRRSFRGTDAERLSASQSRVLPVLSTPRHGCGFFSGASRGGVGEEERDASIARWKTSDEEEPYASLRRQRHVNSGGAAGTGSKGTMEPGRRAQPRALDVLTVGEITKLFFIPLAVATTMILILWRILKYFCNFHDVCER
eukprot:GHVU01219777.1.p1 GENE.GHVU01219777.1~~GHVU01219777.1.p1  ORF type:complete len:314 (-),score=20.54 GHVU01219777.1:93-1034(-)